jgi:hypothetical protein|tara:strand:+ start:7041 stop:7730 length:690 start_codon:yes stop_codon:yes gene_type:complete
MSFLHTNIPHFPCWVRREYTHNHEKFHGEFLHALAISVTAIPDRSLSFQVVFTGAESYDDDAEQNILGGAMWARMPINALVADTPLEEWPAPMLAHLVQPWDCSSREHEVIVIDRVSSSPWIVKIDGEFHTAKYYFTVDYTGNSIADDPAQHKQSHVLELTDAGEYTGNMVALPNNRVRATNPALWRHGEGAPDFKPSQWVINAESDDSYMDSSYTFNNLYSDGEKDGD